VPREPSTAFLSPEAAARVERPGWSVDEDHEPEAGPLLDPCGDGGFPRADDIAASDERAMGSRREVGGSGLAQEVFRYSSPQAAADALAGYADAVERCPERPAPQSPEGYTDRYSVVEQAEEDGVRRLLVRRQPCMPGGQCTAHFRTYLFAARSGDGSPWPTTRSARTATRRRTPARCSRLRRSSLRRPSRASRHHTYDGPAPSRVPGRRTRAV
jgi:hypothetical protein